jgi:hypothetical protein
VVAGFAVSISGRIRGVHGGRQRLVREPPQPITVPDMPSAVWTMDVMHDQLADGRSVRLSTVRYDWLAQTIVDTIDAVPESATHSPWTYNHELPNMAFGCIPPSMKLALAA